MECKGIWGTTLKDKAEQPESHGVWQYIRLLFSVQLLTTAMRMFTALTSYRIRLSALAFDKIVSIPTKSTFTQFARSRVCIIHYFLVRQTSPSSPAKMLSA